MSPDDHGRGETDRIRSAYASYEDGFGERWSMDNPGNRAMRDERTAATAALLAGGGTDVASLRLLDIGCGLGGVLADMQDAGVTRLFGVDLVVDRVVRAHHAYPGLHLCAADATTLPFDDGSFDVVLLFTVISSILDRDVARRVCREAARVLTPGGRVLWYDYRVSHPLNRNTRPVRAREVRELFGGFQADLRTITVLPQLARRLGSRTGALYPRLRALPFLRTHHLGTLTKPA